MVPDSDDFGEIENGLRLMFISSGVLCSLIAILIFIGEFRCIFEQLGYGNVNYRFYGRSVKAYTSRAGVWSSNPTQVVKSSPPLQHLLTGSCVVW